MVRWSAQPWETTRLACRLFGHRVSGYQNDVPYGSLEFFTVDGINRIHLNFRLRCDRCGCDTKAAMAHLGSLTYNINKSYNAKYIRKLVLDAIGESD